MRNSQVTKWTAVSAHHVMMGATLQDGPSLPVSGRQLRAERLSAELSLEKVASHFRRGVTRQAIHKIESRVSVSDSAVSDFRAAIRAARKSRVHFAIRKTANTVR